MHNTQLWRLHSTGATALTWHALTVLSSIHCGGSDRANSAARSASTAPAPAAALFPALLLLLLLRSELRTRHQQRERTARVNPQQSQVRVLHRPPRTRHSVHSQPPLRPCRRLPGHHQAGRPALHHCPPTHHRNPRTPCSGSIHTRKRRVSANKRTLLDATHHPALPHLAAPAVPLNCSGRTTMAWCTDRLYFSSISRHSAASRPSNAFRMLGASFTCDDGSGDGGEVR